MVVKPAEFPLILTEPPNNPKSNREEMVEIMFETFEVPTLNISIQGVLALLGSGRTSGLVLDVGEGVTQTIPVFDGRLLTPGIKRLDMGGQELNTVLAKLLATEGVCLTTTQDRHAVRLMKEQYCFVLQDPSLEQADCVSHALPDGRIIPLGNMRWRCPEVLFNPSLVGLESQGVAGLVWESVEACEIDTRKDLLSKVILSGGTTMFPGFAERLTRELQSFAPARSRIGIAQSENQQYAVWNGAKVIADLQELQEDQWMTRDEYDEYDEYGKSFIHNRMML